MSDSGAANQINSESASQLRSWVSVILFIGGLTSFAVGSLLSVIRGSGSISLMERVLVILGAVSILLGTLYRPRIPLSGKVGLTVQYALITVVLLVALASAVMLPFLIGIALDLPNQNVSNPLTAAVALWVLVAAWLAYVIFSPIMAWKWWRKFRAAKAGEAEKITTDAFPR